MSFSNPYALIAPIAMAFLGLALVSAWNFDRHQRPLLHMGLGIVVTSLSLGAQSVMPVEAIARYAVLTSLLYLCGAWLIGRGMAYKFNTRYYTSVVAVICVLALPGIYYYSHIEDDLGMRASILGAGLCLLHILPAVHVFKRRQYLDKLDVVLYWSYLFFCVYTFLRPVTLLLLSYFQDAALVRSIFWFSTMLGSILFCMTFTCLLLASSIRSIFRKLHRERDLDLLTNLLNRRAFEEVAMQAVKRRDATPSVHMMCDIDFLKKINDTWGHLYGDEVLRDVAECLRQSTRRHDLVARYGGEEFVLLLPQADITSAHHVAQRIQSRLTQACHRLPNQADLTLSIGLTEVQADDTLSSAIQRADLALYQAKHAGRNCALAA